MKISHWGVIYYGRDSIKQSIPSSYAGACIVLTTKHHKSIGIALVFERILGAGVLEYVADTDMLDTFSGEVERKGSALECVKINVHGA